MWQAGEEATHLGQCVFRQLHQDEVVATIGDIVLGPVGGGGLAGGKERASEGLGSCRARASRIRNRTARSAGENALLLCFRLLCLKWTAPLPSLRALPQTPLLHLLQLELASYPTSLSSVLHCI